MAENEFYKRWPFLGETVLDNYHTLDLSHCSDETLWGLLTYTRVIGDLVGCVCATRKSTGEPILYKEIVSDEYTYDSQWWNEAVDRLMMGQGWRKKMSAVPTPQVISELQACEMDVFETSTLNGRQSEALYAAYRGKQ